MTERIQLNDDQRQALLNPKNLPTTIQVNKKEYAPQRPIDAGYKGAVWQVHDEFSRPRALKLCIYNDYQERSYIQEVLRAAALEPYREFARLLTLAWSISPWALFQRNVSLLSLRNGSTV